MKIVVVGGTGLIGTKLLLKLRSLGHEALAASPNSGVDTLTGQGLAEALKGAAVVVDVSNSPSFEDQAVLKFFETSTQNQLAAEREAGVQHHVALSIVGTDRWPESGYFRAKLAQEKLVSGGAIPYSIVRATQFFEFSQAIAAVGTRGEQVHLASVAYRPIAADDVASALAKVAVAAPLRAIVDVAGPEEFRLDELIRLALRANNDPREVVADEAAGYFGARVGDRTLVPSGDARFGEIRFQDWLKSGAQK